MTSPYQPYGQQNYRSYMQALRGDDARKRLETQAMQRHGYIAKINCISEDGLREFIDWPVPRTKSTD